GTKQDNFPVCVPLAMEQGKEPRGVIGAVPTLELVEAAHRKTRIPGTHHAVANLAVFDHADLVGPERAEFIEPPCPMYDPGTFTTEPRQYLGDRPDPLRRIDPEQVA